MTAAFPASVPTTAQLRGDIGDNVATFLSAGIDGVVTTIPVDDTSEFPSAGLASIKKASGLGLVEVFSYTGKTANSFTGVTRDFNGKGSDSYAENDEVHLYWVANHHNRHVEETIAVADNIRNRFGLNTDIVIPNGIGKEFNGLTVLKSPSVGANNLLEIKAAGGAAVWDVKFTDATGALDFTPSTSTYPFKINAALTLGISGTLSNCSYSWSADPNTGINYISSGTFSFIANGVVAATIDGNARLQINAGALSTPGLRFITDNDTGLMLSALGQMDLVASAQWGLRIKPFTALIRSGSVGAPALAFDAQVNCGAYFVSASRWALVANGNRMIDMSDAGAYPIVQILGQARFIDGTAAAPSMTFSSETGTGFLRPAANTIAWSTGGTQKGFLWNGGIRAPDGSVSYSAYSFVNNPNTGMYAISYNLVFANSGVEVMLLEKPADLSATETSLRIYDKDNAALEHVTVGAANSGGAGFKLLRIVN